MIANSFGRRVSLTQMRELAGTDRNSTNPNGLIIAAGKSDLEAKVVKGTIANRNRIAAAKFRPPRATVRILTELRSKGQSSKQGTCEIVRGLPEIYSSWNIIMHK